ncbi:MAG: hypothetical protein AB7R69_00480 [Candidatus Babeliales bacterium]
MVSYSPKKLFFFMIFSASCMQGSDQSFDALKEKTKTKWRHIQSQVYEFADTVKEKAPEFFNTMKNKAFEFKDKYLPQQEAQQSESSAIKESVPGAAATPADVLPAQETAAAKEVAMSDNAVQTIQGLEQNKDVKVAWFSKRTALFFGAGAVALISVGAIVYILYEDGTLTKLADVVKEHPVKTGLACLATALTFYAGYSYCTK